MKRQTYLTVTVFLFFVTLSSRVNTGDEAEQCGGKENREAIEPIEAPFAMPHLERLVFADKVFDIREYGTVADGTTKNTKAFAEAIEVCAAAGGGRVLVPEGKWYTGPIHLKSTIELHLTEGAEIIFSDCFEDYLPVVLVRVGGIELYNYSPLIYARDCDNIAVTGEGRLNGNAEKWWPWKERETRGFFDMGAAGWLSAARCPATCVMFISTIAASREPTGRFG